MNADSVVILWPLYASIWSVMAQYFHTSGYKTISDFYDGMNAANPQVYAWRFVKPGTLVILAHA